jgi:hypothetical protein
MAQFTQKPKIIGASLWIAIPRKIARKENIRDGDLVRIIFED